MELDIWGAFSGGSSVDTILIVIVVLAGLFAAYMIMRFIKLFVSYNIKVEITDLTRGNQIIKFDKAKEFQTKEGRQKVGLLFSRGREGKATIEYPSEKYLDITSSGKKFLRLKKIDVDTYIPWHPSIIDEDVNTRNEKYMTPEQKSAWITENERSKEYGKNNIWDLISKAIPFITIIVAAIMMVVVMDVTADKHVEIAEINAETADTLAKQAEISNSVNQELLNFLKDQASVPRLPTGVDAGDVPD